MICIRRKSVHPKVSRFLLFHKCTTIPDSYQELVCWPRSECLRMDCGSEHVKLDLYEEVRRWENLLFLGYDNMQILSMLSLMRPCINIHLRNFRSETGAHCKITAKLFAVLIKARIAKELQIRDILLTGVEKSNVRFDNRTLQICFATRNEETGQRFLIKRYSFEIFES